MSFYRGLTAAQNEAIAGLEAEHGFADSIIGGPPKPAVFVDFNSHSADFRSFRIDMAGAVVDVTDSLLEDS